MISADGRQGTATLGVLQPVVRAFAEHWLRHPAAFRPSISRTAGWIDMKGCVVPHRKTSATL